MPWGCKGRRLYSTWAKRKQAEMAVQQQREHLEDGVAERTAEPTRLVAQLDHAEERLTRLVENRTALVVNVHTVVRFQDRTLKNSRRQWPMHSISSWYRGGKDNVKLYQKLFLTSVFS